MLTTIECWAVASSATSSPCTLSRGAKNVLSSSGYPSRNRPSALKVPRLSHTNGASAISTPLSVPARGNVSRPRAAGYSVRPAGPRAGSRSSGPGTGRPEAGSAAGVVAGPVPVDHDDRLVPHHPGVVPLGQRGDVSRPGVELHAVGHHDVQRALHVVLEMRRLAQVGAGERLDVLRPAP